MEGAKLAGFADEYEAMISLLVKGGGAAATPKKRGGKKVAEETEEDRRVNDDDFVMALEAACAKAEAHDVRAPDWFREMYAPVTKDGFYVRIERLVRGGKVSVREELINTKLYGRSVKMRVKLYHSVEGDREDQLREERAKAKQAKELAASRHSSQQEGGAE